MKRTTPLGFGKIALIIIGLLMLLFVFRIGWLFYHQPSNDFTAQNGVINFKDASFTDDTLYTLDGEWKFYPGEFIAPNSNDTSQSVIEVPGDWNDKLDNEQKVDVYGSGSYQLTIQLPDNDLSSYRLRFMKLATAGDVYINGEKIGSYNDASQTPGTKGSTRGPFVTSFHTDENQLNVVVHVSNFNHPLNGGLNESVKIGTETAVNQETQYFTTLQIVVSVIYFLHSLYALALWLLSGRKHLKELLFYGIMATLAGITILIDDETVVQMPFDLNISANIMLFLMNSTLLTMLLFIKHLFNLQSRAYYLFYSIFTLFCIIQVIVPYEYLSITSSLIGIYYLTTIGYLFVQTIKMIRRGFPDAILVLLFVTSYSSNALWGAAIKFAGIPMPYYPFDFIISILAIAFILFSRQKRVMDLNRQQTKQLQEADRQKDIFLANTSHELRTPLHGILNIAQLLKEDESSQKLSQQHHHYLNTLTQIGHQMTFTLNDLLDATRLKEKGIKLYPKRFDLRSVVSAVLDMTHLFSDQKNIGFSMKINASFPTLYADENRTIQILFNLIHNGIKFTNHGTITIKAELDQTETMALIHISDTGSGVEPDQLEGIFQPYEQGSAISNEGVGLGLSVSRQLVELHGGTIHAESEPGEGTTVTFSLPIAKGSAPEWSEETVAASLEGDMINTHGILDNWEVPADRSQSREEQARILIVEDDPVNLKVLQAILSQGYQIFSSSNIGKALELIHHRNDWDLIISDVMMPDMSGYEFTRKVRETYSMAELPIILLTARQQQEDIYTGFMAGANDYVTKPVTAVEIRSRVHALTSLKHSVQAQLRSEAAWLQAQIRPHFLFNALNTIAALSEIDKDRMVKLLNIFGDYLRQSFESYNTADLISFDAEVALIESYLYIEKERFGDRLQVKWEINKHTDVQIPPLSIQPLVENAIRHGVLKKQAGGTICIRLLSKADNWLVEVEDDGVGMNQNEIDEIHLGNPTNGGSVGFSNTDKRLRQQFGEGLKIESEKGKGTTIYFHIPK